jgi:hypothetical protein
MKPSRFRVFIVLMVLLEIVWFVSPQFGSTMGESYRHRERLAALKAASDNPSPTTTATVEDELSRVRTYVGYRHLMTFAGLLILDAIAMFYFWNNGSRKTTA